jgi:N-acetylmuramic acid 6-phosphate etherase
MIKLGRTYGNMMLDLRISNEKLLKRGIRIVADISGASESAAAEALKSTNLNVRDAVELLTAGSELTVESSQ